MEEFVVYKALHETEFDSDAWSIRPKDMFLGKAVLEQDGVRVLVPRFEYLENAEL
ncbi:MAG TPA: DUF1653 domain-containing protein [Nanoarchaeota archaeon]|nr:DUF1653 domain-containing protein [Nanoarchaeota archaeon]HIH50739.1 DUF1653 domain-containing protein [Nanoarchaeota archaeon]HIH66146.1 DUF1653 domain-containing protein [Nanoarchaeota archaeon]